jgi:hypothetical protein
VAVAPLGDGVDPPQPIFSERRLIGCGGHQPLLPVLQRGLGRAQDRVLRA